MLVISELGRNLVEYPRRSYYPLVTIHHNEYPREPCVVSHPHIESSD